jgi:hypothetical protein
LTETSTSREASSGLRTRWVRRVAIVVALVVLAVSWRYYLQRQRGMEQLKGLLCGHHGAVLRSVRVQIGGNPVLQTADSQLIAYLSAQARQAITHPYASAGEPATFTFVFEGGATVTVTGFVVNGGISLSMPDQALEDTFPTHEIRFGPPIPGPFQALLQYSPMHRFFREELMDPIPESVQQLVIVPQEQGEFVLTFDIASADMDRILAHPTKA